MTKAAELAKMGEVLTNSQIGGRRNIIINGAMQVAQRGTSISRGASNIDYTLDRFFSRANSSCTHTVTQETDVPDGFQNSLKIVRDSGQTGTAIRLEQPFETSAITQCRGQKVTLSFYAKKDSGATVSTLSVNLYTGDGTEGQRAITAYANEVSAINNETATLTSSWQRFTFTSSSTLITDLSQMAFHVVYSPTGTAPSNDGYFITGIQLEVGEQATPFEHRSFGEELALCQRYCYVANSTTRTALCSAYFNTTTAVRGGIVTFPVTMRSAPTITEEGTDSNYNIARPTTSNAGASGVPTTTQINTNSYELTVTSNSASTAGFPTRILLLGDAEITMDSEL